MTVAMLLVKEIVTDIVGGHVEMIVTQNVKIIVLAVAVEIVKVTVKVIV